MLAEEIHQPLPQFPHFQQVGKPILYSCPSILFLILLPFNNTRMTTTTDTEFRSRWFSILHVEKVKYNCQYKFPNVQLFQSLALGLLHMKTKPKTISADQSCHTNSVCILFFFKVDPLKHYLDQIIKGKFLMKTLNITKC